MEVRNSVWSAVVLLLLGAVNAKGGIMGLPLQNNDFQSYYDLFVKASFGLISLGALLHLLQDYFVEIVAFFRKLVAVVPKK